MMRLLPMALAAGSILSGCEHPRPSPRQCLSPVTEEGVVAAQVGGVPLTVEHLAASIRAQGSAAVRRYGDPKAMRRYIEDQVRFHLLVQAALERGLDRDPDVVEAAHKVMVRKLLQRDMGTEAFQGTVGDAAIARYYERHREEYVQPEKRRIADIQLAPTESGRVLAQNLVGQLQKASDTRKRFRFLAAKHSLNNETKNRGGESLYQTRQEVTDAYGPTYAEEVFTREPGSLIARPVQSTRGWHVITVVSVRDTLTRGLDEVREEIRERLMRSQRSKVFENYLSGLKERHPVAIYETRIPEVVEAITQNPRSPAEGRGEAP